MLSQILAKSAAELLECNIAGWKMEPLEMYILLKMGDFPASYLSLTKGILYRLKTQTVKVLGSKLSAPKKMMKARLSFLRNVLLESAIVY